MYYTHLQLSLILKLLFEFVREKRERERERERVYGTSAADPECRVVNNRIRERER